MKYNKLSTQLCIGLVVAWAGAAHAKPVLLKESEPGLCYNYDDSCKTNSEDLKAGEKREIKAYAYYNVPYPEPFFTTNSKEGKATLKIFDINNKVVKEYKVRGFLKVPHMARKDGRYRMEIAMPNNEAYAPYVGVVWR